MKCPACRHRQNFFSWLLRPGPRRTCNQCGALLHYRGFGWQVAANAALGAFFVTLWVISTLPTITLGAMAAGTFAVSCVILPWFLGKYRIADDLKPGHGKIIWWSAAAILTAITLGYTYENWRGAQALRCALEKLQDRGESLKLSEIYAPRSVSDQANVATVPIIAGLFKQPQDSSLTTVSVPWKNAAKQPKSLEEMANAVRPGFKGNETDAAEVVLSSLAPNGPALSELRSALGRPEIRWPLNYGDPALPLPHITALNNSAKVLEARGRASLATGNIQQAGADTRALCRISEVIAESPLLMTQLLAASILGRAQTVIEDGIQRGSWSPEQLAEWKRLLRADCTQRLAQALRVERAAFGTMDWQRLNPWFAGDNEHRAFQAFLIMRPSGWAGFDKAYYLESMQKFIDQTESPTAHANGSLGINNKMSLLFRLKHMLSVMSLPALEPLQARVSATDAKSIKLQAACSQAMEHAATQ